MKVPKYVIRNKVKRKVLCGCTAVWGAPEENHVQICFGDSPRYVWQNHICDKCGYYRWYEEPKEEGEDDAL